MHIMWKYCIHEKKNKKMSILGPRANAEPEPTWNHKSDFQEFIVNLIKMTPG